MRKRKTLLEVLKLATDYLEQNGVEQARLNAERLLAHALDLDRVALYLNYDRPLSETELARFREFVRRRGQREPLQYILGETEFFSLPFKVNRDVLIPRPETEILVERTVERCLQRFGDEATCRILDVGTGSGCIAVSLAKSLPQVEVVAVDVSAAALEVAAENARRNGVAERVRFLQHDFLTGDLPQGPAFEVVVSNPPYVSERDFHALPEEIRLHEPAVALKDGLDGLSFFRRIAGVAAKHVAPNGFVAVEIGMGQAQPVETIFKQNGWSRVEIFVDLNGTERVLMCEK